MLVNIWNKIKEFFTVRKDTIKHYAESSLITFLTFFLPALLVELNQKGFDGILGAGWIGLGAMLARLIGKAVYETVKILIVKLIEKLKK